MPRDRTSMLGVAGFEPMFYSHAERVPPALLTPLVERRLTASWVAWDLAEDSWFEDAPIVLEFDDLHVELCHFKLDQLSITMGSIDLATGLDWYGAGAEIPLAWRKDAHPVLAAAVGQTVSQVRLVEYKFGLAEFVGTASWVLTGFELGFQAGGCIAVNNGLDCNTITDAASEGPEYRVLAFPLTVSPGAA